MAMDIGIDLGTATVLVYVKGKGIVLKEPSVVAIDRNTNKIIKVGTEAQNMIGRSPSNIAVVRPLKDGAISQYDITLKMLEYFIKKTCGSLFFKPHVRVVICVPSGITEVEERAVADAAMQAGARDTQIIEEPLAAAIGAGIDITAPTGHLVVDIGGGTTDIAVVSLGGIVVSSSIKVAGDKFDEAIIRYVKNQYGVLIGERTAEEVKIKIGSVWNREEQRMIEVKGRSLREGLPKVITLSSADMPIALEEPITSIIDAICSVIERTPPELIGDILYNGITLTGGGSLLFGLDKLIESVTGVRTKVADKPVQCVAIGTGKAMDIVEETESDSIFYSRTNNYIR